MLKNYLTVALRILRKYRGYSFINVTGLAVGFASAILIILFVQDDLLHDAFHENADNLYRVVVQREQNGRTLHSAVTPAPLAVSLQTAFPEIEDAACFNNGGGGLISYQEKRFVESSFSFTDPSFFKMFSFPFLLGDPETALDDPYAIVLSESKARKYFGNEDPIGKVLHVMNVGDLIVTGVIADTRRSHIILDFVVSNRLYESFGVDVENWGRYNYTTYLLLHETADEGLADQKIYGYLTEVLGPEHPVRLRLQPLEKIYLHSELEYDVHARTSHIAVVGILGLLAVFILVIACVNFVNLSTARAEQRVKEIGMRKVMGAARTQLVIQLLGEAILTVMVALSLALLITITVLPSFNNLMLGFKHLTLHDIFSPRSLCTIIVLTLSLGIFAGAYPAFFLSSFKPAVALKGTTAGGRSRSRFRKILVVSQFSLSILIVLTTIIINKQLLFMQHEELGYDSEHLVYLGLNDEMRDKYQSMKEEYGKIPGVINVTASMNLPTWEWPSINLTEWEGNTGGETMKMHHGSIDYDFFKVMGMDFVEGRAFSPEYPSDPTSALIINEEAVRSLGFNEPVGQYLSMWGHEGWIVGVVKDFHFDSMRKRIQPLVLKLEPQAAHYMIARISPGEIPRTLSSLKEAASAFVPDYPIEFHFLDEQLEAIYFPERLLRTIMSIFSGLTIFIAGLGLVGLASFTLERRRKEISIRKTLGASALKVFSMFSLEFTKWILVANLIAWPIAYFLMRLLLQYYAYRTEISLMVFLVTGIATMAFALLTVAFQTNRAARTNPVKALKCE